MKKFILGFIVALAVIAIIYFTYPFIRGFLGSGGGGLVSPENLNPSVKDYGSLRVEIFGKGSAISDVEVDLGKINEASGPTGPMTFAITDSSGAISFEKVPVGDYDIFSTLLIFRQDMISRNQIVFLSALKKIRLS